jgi:hypothetical protein
MLKKKLSIKKSIIFLFIFLLSLNLNIITTQAFNIRNFNESSGLNRTAGESGYLNLDSSGNDLEKKIANIISVGLSLIGIIFLILMLYSGFLWMTAKGDKNAVEKAKENIKTALIGIIIILGAYTITQLITGLITK